MKLKSKIVLTTISTLFCILSIALLSLTYFSYKEKKENQNTQLQNDIFTSISELDKVFKQANLVGRDISRLGEFLFDIKTLSFFNTKEILEQNLKNKLKDNSELGGMGLWYELDTMGEKYLAPYALKKNENIEITWEYSNEKYNYTNQPWYKMAIPEGVDKTKERTELQYLTLPFLNPNESEKSVSYTLATLMYSKQKKIIGISTVDIHLKSFYNNLKKLEFGAESYPVLIDKTSGRIIYHKDSDFILKDYKELNILKSFQIDKVQKSKIEESVIKEDKKNYLLHSILINSNIVFVLIQNSNESPVSLRGIIIRNLIILLFSLFFVYVFVDFLVNRSLEPLKEILSILGGILTGKKTINDRILVKSSDEFGELASKYNEVAYNMQKNNLELREQAERLDEKINSKNNQLNTTLEEINLMRRKQDGDYFLTSLLLDPLSRKKLESRNIEINFLVKQKNQFNFNKYSKQIGGDLCTAETIYLASQPYTFFLNADAMGKSHQGAEGAIVLGSVIHIILNRTAKENSDSISPESWLSKTISEMDLAFKIFNGSMLVSAFVGLLDDTNGYLYYVNAGHSKVVYYKDKKAQFLEEKVHYAKLGANETDIFFINSTHLQKSDILVLSSDGKDSLLSKIDKSMQQDETKFLNFIETTNADILEVHNELSKLGEFDDDFSILSIEYKRELHTENVLSSGEKDLLSQARSSIDSQEYEKAITLLEKIDSTNLNHRETLKEKIRLYSLTKSYIALSQVSELYLKLNPEEEIIYLCANSYKILRKMAKAFLFSERLYLRQNFKTEYLQNYLELCKELGFVEKYNQAKRVLEA